MQGVYTLIIKNIEDSFLKIGNLGSFNFPKGYYIYVGSALGKNSSTNLENRLKRHLKNNKKLHWHIDYLLHSPNASIIKICYAETNERFECKILKSIKKQSKKFQFIIKNFGSSDCKSGCNSHLLYINEDLDKITNYIIEAYKNNNLITKFFENR